MKGFNLPIVVVVDVVPIAVVVVDVVGVVVVEFVITFKN